MYYSTLIKYHSALTAVGKWSNRILVFVGKADKKHGLGQLLQLKDV